MVFVKMASQTIQQRVRIGELFYANGGRVKQFDKKLCNIYGSNNCCKIF